MGLHGTISVPELDIEADLGWSWLYPHFCKGCSWDDATIWPTHNLIGFHAPNWNELYDIRRYMVVYIHGIHSWQSKTYVVEDIGIVDDDALLQVPTGPRLLVVICYPDRPWPQRLLIHLVELEHADFYGALEEEWR